MPRLLLQLGTLLLATLHVTACLGPSHARYHSAAERQSTSVSYVLGPDELWRRGSAILDVIDTHLPTIQVTYNTATCPRVTLRGGARFDTAADPQVYMDGQPALDTCLLQMIRASDVSRVEVYPMGVTPRSGYATHPYGLILVFSRRADP